MDKQALREKMRERRARLTDRQVAKASRVVYERAIELPQVKDAKVVLVYADFDNEVRTGELTGWLLYNGKKVALPFIEDHEMDAAPFRGNLHTTKLGYLEPDGTRGKIDAKDIDLIICPGIAFTDQLDRIGFGKGYYDAFFARAKNAYRLALAYDFQIVPDADAQPHDVKVNAIVTPSRVIS